MKVIEWDQECEACERNLLGEVRQGKEITVAKTYVHTVKVIPDGLIFQFPLDMLRYDSCYPDTQDDVARIITTLDPRRGAVNRKKEDLTVSVVHIGEMAWRPTDDRWKSFGWKVVEHQARGY